MLSAAQLTIRLHPNDDVVIARVQLISGTLLRDENLTVKGMVPPGHKIATRAIAAGSPVRRYNQIIGFASKAIAVGEHVHMNNLAMGEFERDYAFGIDVRPVTPALPQATFMGFKRADNRVATRNYIGLLSTVNCSATVCKLIAEHFRGDALRDFPNVDGVVAVTHSVGCGMDVQGEGMTLLRRTLAG
jgi:altronate hydrolase